MAPTRLIGRFRPALLAAGRADAVVLGRLPWFVGSVVIPLVVVGIAASVAASHAFSSGTQLPPQVLDWSRLRVDFIFTEVPLFLLATCVIGAISPAAGVLFVLSFGVLDLAASTTHPAELRITAAYPVPIVARLVALWLLWVLAVEVPSLGRVLAASVRRAASSRFAVAAIAGVATGGLTFLWAQAAAVLIRPVFLWSDLRSIPTMAIVPLQAGGLFFGLAAGIAAAAVVLHRGPGRLLYPSVLESDATPGPRSSRTLAVTVARRLVVAGLLTVGLGGLIEPPLDAVVLFVAIAGARPLAQLITSRTSIGLVLPRVPLALRVAVAVALIYVVAIVLIDSRSLKTVSDFFPIIAVAAVGVFIIELLTAPGSARASVRPSVARAVGLGAVISLALLAIGLVLPLPVLADNCATFNDCWSTVALALPVAVAVPVLFWLATANALGDKPPPPKPLTWDPRTPREKQDRKKYHEKDTYKEETE